MSPTIDVNCDVGEGAGNDEALMALISSASIACGAHAGDAATMRATVRMAVRHGVAIGAHPGYADRGFFGRREWALPREELVSLVRTQVEALRAIAREEGARVSYVKPHGALYNQAARETVVADAIAEAVFGLDACLRIYGLAGGALLEAGRARGLRVVSEVFADRTYQADGSLTPRTCPGSLVEDEATAVAQVLRMVKSARVRATDGAEVAITADTVCLHGDSPRAVAFGRALRTALSDAGVRVGALG